MNIREYGVLFWTVVGIITLLVASPALSRLLVYPQTEFFTEMWLLGSNHTAEDYPFNITSGQTYNIYLYLANHLGYSAYYVVEVKFRNSTQSAPTSFGPPANQTPSSLPSLFNITAFVADEATWETPLTFSFDYAVNETLMRVSFKSMTLNGVMLDLNGYNTSWNATRNMFPSNLVFELWLYNSTTNSFKYNQRFLSLWLNMTG
jgi:hypothetical protein